MPFTTQELFQNGKEALYYGINALSNNLIMVDRKLLKNPNGLILGTPGSGKSFSAKREIANCFLLTSDEVEILDPEGVEISQPADIIRDPYVFEFLGVPENKPMLESDLEKALVAQIEKFLLELGRGFMFVGTQQRVTLNNTHYYVDMVFYNKILRAYVLIELKTKKLTPEAAGQLNMYLNYYAAEVNDPDDNPPIGIILCTEKDSIAAEYALGGLSNNIFASRYVLYMPDKEQLIAQVEAVLKNWHEKKDNRKRTDWKSTFSGLSSMPAPWLCGSGGCADGGRCPAKAEI